MLDCRTCSKPVMTFLHMDYILCKACVKQLIPQVPMIVGFKAQYIHSDLTPVDGFRRDLVIHDFSQEN